MTKSTSARCGSFHIEEPTLAKELPPVAGDGDRLENDLGVTRKSRDSRAGGVSRDLRVTPFSKKTRIAVTITPLPSRSTKPCDRYREPLRSGHRSDLEAALQSYGAADAE
jgi:hypothetical protein